MRFSIRQRLDRSDQAKIVNSLNQADRQILKLFESETDRTCKQCNHLLIPHQALVLRDLAYVHHSLVVLMSKSASAEKAITSLDNLVITIKNTREELPINARHESAVLAKAESIILRTASPFLSLPVLEQVTTIVVQSDILYQAYSSLFPAERMIVSAGRCEGSKTILSATFDVTGDSNSGHVRADANRLGKALIAMDKAGTFLTAWMHSHPGKGTGATKPSSIDDRQYADWIRDFSPRLLAVIFVENGYIRFWGNPVKSRKIKLEIIGSGLEQINSDSDLVFRLE